MNKPSKTEIIVVYPHGDEENEGYSLEQNGNKMVLKASNFAGGRWILENCKENIWTDTENGIVLQLAKRKPIKLDYCEIEILHLFLTIRALRDKKQKFEIKQVSDLN